MPVGRVDAPMSSPAPHPIAIVTGANSGVGLETARGLARAGFHVVLAVRRVERGEAARQDIARSAPKASLEVMALDLASLASVRAFAEGFLARHDALHLLVNNAGIHTSRNERTPDGFEKTFATNHLGHFLLTNLLMEALKKGAPSRVVTVASEAHRYGRMRFDDLMGDKGWNGVTAYNQSKLANILFARELARRLEGTGVTSHAVHPGVVRSNWARGAESGLLRLGVALASPFMLTPAQGARTPLHAALSDEAGHKSGVYYKRSKPAQPSREAQDREAAARLWNLSEKLVGLDRPALDRDSES